MHFKSTALDEACIHTYTIKSSLQGNASIVEGPSLPKLCPRGPFSGSELSFALALPEGATAAERAWDIAGGAQDALEPLIMVAAPMAIQLRTKGFTEQVGSAETGAWPSRILYSLDDLPDEASSSERLMAGLHAFFGASADAPALAGEAKPHAEAVTPVRIHISPSVTAKGVAGKGEDAMVWTACAGLVLDKNTAEHEKPQDSPTGAIRVYCFEKYAVMLRPLETLLKALERLDWASFGLSVQAIVSEGTGTARLVFAHGSDAACLRMRALVIHLVPPLTRQSPSKAKKGDLCPSAQLQAKLVKSAVTGALLAMKESCPLTLLSGFEQRMGCLADIARIVSTLVAQSGNEAFQAAACRAASTDLNNLKDAIHERLEQIAVASIPRLKGIRQQTEE
ncbi:hypothetical protein CVIRNUC_011090 [Coccomyxa viridis]|uniref:Uncharacterized protein n=1 Tax=Coccomyxa viridis TaxID=1274662 RepID=A0AAV1IKT5_9CHLO|nr:hypothetical protein CVIRNUC_011090 [Coccomyxa viridis]